MKREGDGGAGCGDYAGSLADEGRHIAAIRRDETREKLATVQRATEEKDGVIGALNKGGVVVEGADGVGEAIAVVRGWE